MMPKSVAIEILSKATRDGLVDYAFGDAEITWRNQYGNIVADGYSGRSGASVSMDASDKYEATIFEDRSMVNLGIKGHIERNDYE